jgi:DNA-binding transcriptional LysR family regulator
LEIIMKINQLRDAIAVAERGSLRAASRHLGLAQSAITKSIQLLEKELGAPIFERQKKGVVPTPMGLLFLRRARIAREELERAREEIQQHMGGGSGRVVASLSTVPHMAILPEVLPDFLKKYPDVDLIILEGLGFRNVETQLRDAAVDFYLGVEPPYKLPAGFTSERLFANQRVVIGRSQHPLRNAKSLRELSQARWVMSGPPFTEQLQEVFTRQKIAPPTKFSFASSVIGQIVLILNSDMLALVPRQWLDFPLFQGRIQKLNVRERIETPSIIMVRRSAFPLTPAAEHFCDLARRVAANM